MIMAVALSCQTGYSQTFPHETPGSQKDINVKAIQAWYGAFVKKDWTSIQRVLADGFTFSSPVDDHIKLKAFKERCWPNAYNIKRVEVDKFVMEGDVAFVIANGWTNDGKLFRNTDCFMLKNGKISAYECFFGPGVNYPNSGK